MPTATEFFGYNIANIGPLTTTFTAAPACATTNDKVYYGNGSAPTAIFGPPTCELQSLAEDCFPSGGAFNDVVEVGWDRPGQGDIVYFSPGLACPAGWTTAGTLADTSATNGSSTVAADGIFTQGVWGQSGGRNTTQPRILQARDIFEGILDPGETVALCCPSNYQALNAGCYSSLGPPSSYTQYSEICYRQLPGRDIVTVTSFDGKSWSPPLLSLTDAVSELRTETQTITPGYWDDQETIVAIITEIPAVALVYQATDTDSTPNTAAAVVPAPVSVKSLLSVLPVFVGLLAGAGLMVPW